MHPAAAAAAAAAVAVKNNRVDASASVLCGPMLLVATNSYGAAASLTEAVTPAATGRPASQIPQTPLVLS
jgi:hypothetical protein